MSYLGATELVFPGGVSIGTQTTPYSLSGVASLIFEFEGEVDGYAAAAGYDVPITPAATYAYATMRRAVRNAVTGAVLDTLFNRDATQKSGSTSNSYQAAYDTFRKSLKDGSLILVGATQAGEADGLVLPRAGGTASPMIDFCTEF